MCIKAWGEFASVALVTETKREKAKKRNNKEKASESCHYFYNKKMKKGEEFVMKQGEMNEVFIVKGFEEEVRSGVVIS